MSWHLLYLLLPFVVAALVVVYVYWRSRKPKPVATLRFLQYSNALRGKYGTLSEGNHPFLK